MLKDGMHILPWQGFLWQEVIKVAPNRKTGEGGQPLSRLLKLSGEQPEGGDRGVTFIKATQIKRDESDSQSLTKVLYHQKPLQEIKLGPPFANFFRNIEGFKMPYIMYDVIICSN